MSAVALVSGIGLFACGVALTLLFGWHWVHQALQESYTDGAQSMLDEAKAMQTHTYITLAGAQNENAAAREITLRTIDAMVIGLQDEMNQLRGAHEEETT